MKENLPSLASGYRQIVFWLGLCITFLAPARADLVPQLEGKRPPIPTNTGVQVLRGQIVELTLSAATASSKDVTFSLIDTPKYGKLIDKAPKRVDGKNATMRYQSDAASKESVDGLKFTCRIGEGPVSSVGEVKIKLVDLAPELQAEAVTLDFGNVRYGLEEQREVVIRNIGTGPYQGTVTIPEGGWKLPEGSLARQLNIASGAGMVLTVIYKPERLGEIRGEIVFQNSSVTVGTRARGTSPFMATPAVFLPYERGVSSREGSFKIENPGLDGIEVKLALLLQEPNAPESLLFPERVLLKSRESVNVPVKLVKNITGNYRATLLLSCMGASQEVVIGSDSAPADLSLAGDYADGGLDFGLLKPDERENASKTLIIKNAGGTVGKVFGLPPQSFVAENFSQGVEVPANGELAVRFTINPQAFGKLLEEVEWNSGSNKLRFSLRGEVALQAGGGSPFGAPDLSYNLLTDTTPITELSKNKRQQKMIEQHYGRIVGDYTIDVNLPNPTDLRQIGQTKDSVTMSWLPPAGDGWKYTVLSRGFSVFRGKENAGASRGDLLNSATVTWESVGNISVTEANGRVQTTLSGVDPNWQGTLAVLATNADGKSTRLSRYASAGVLQAKPFNWTPVYVCMVLAIIGLFSYWRWRRNRWFNKAYKRTYHIEHNDTSAPELHV